MSKITVLSQHLVNKIAAGEVVERPASVLKELLENSLDAGALRMAVEIEDGGKKLIRVSDDGAGMTADDLELAVAPHATSKITDEDDLYAIGTFGFRGEALPSIASVSRMEIVSRPHDAIEGAKLEIAGGQSQPIAPAPAAPGTVVSIGNLFFNTPARRKFLRTTNTEMGHLTEQFTRIALAHTEAHFSLAHNGRSIYDLPAGQSRRQRISVLFSNELADSLIPIQRKDRAIEITGLIAPPQQSRSGSQWQYIFLNGRHIRDRFISHAIREAYRGLLEINRQPVVFIFLQLEPHLVDVNVHPAKTEVRFADSNAIHSQVLAAIRDRLLSTDLSVSYHGALTKPSTAADIGPVPAQETDGQRQKRVRQAMADFFKSAGPPTHPTPPPTGTGYRSGSTPPPYSTGPSAPPAPPPATTTPLNPPTADTSTTLPSTEPPAPTIEPTLEKTLPFVQIHNAYLVTETEDGLLIIDQHALHERIIYEKLHQQLNQGPLVSQGRLIPEAVDVTAEQLAVVENAAELLKQLGITLEQFGPHALAIHSFPLLLDKVNPPDFIADLIDVLQSQSGQTNREELLHKVLDMMACKAAVKAGDPLSDDEIKSLIAQRHIVERSSNCPHGRPTSVRMSLDQLEKQFKRT